MNYSQVEISLFMDVLIRLFYIWNVLPEQTNLRAGIIAWICNNLLMPNNERDIFNWLRKTHFFSSLTIESQFK